MYKTFPEENLNLMKSNFTKNNEMYDLTTSNVLNLHEINTKRFRLYSFSFDASHLLNQLQYHIKNKRLHQ